MSRIYSLGLLMVAVSLASAAGPIQGPYQGPVQAQGYAVQDYKVYAEALPVCCDRCIKYVQLRPRLEPCGPHYETVLLVKDCWDCCYVKVPMCLPQCCQGEPHVCRKGMSVAEYTWTSGYKVRVILNKRGKVFVHYNA